MSDQDRVTQRISWERVLTGILAITFGVCAIAFPAGIMLGRLLDLIFGGPKHSASMAALATLLALVAWVAIDGLLHLLVTDMKDKRAARLRGVTGVAVAIAAIVWPDQTASIAVELIGLWGIFVGVLELYLSKYSHYTGKDRALLILSAVASILIGVGIMIWAFWGAVVISATVGVLAIARGVSLIMSGISDGSHSHQKQSIAA